MSSVTKFERQRVKAATDKKSSWLGSRIPPWLRSVKTLLVLQLLIALVIVAWVRPAFEQAQLDNRHQVYVRLRALAHQLRWHCQAGEYRPTYTANRVTQKSKFAFSWRLEIMRREDPVTFSDSTYRAAKSQNVNDVKSALSGVTSHFSSSRCPASIGTDRTAFAAVVDQDTIVQANKIATINEIMDGTEHTGMLLELMHSDFDWWEPRDLTIDQAIAEIQRCPLPSGLLVAMANGRVVGVPPETPPAEIRKLFSMSDGIPNINYRLPFANAKSAP